MKKQMLNEEKLNREQDGLRFARRCIIVVCVLVSFFLTTVLVARMSEDYCLRILADSTEQFAAQIKHAVESDMETLQIIRKVLENAEDFSDEHIQSLIKEIAEKNSLNDIAVLLPDNKMIFSSDEYLDWEGTIAFEEEVDKAPCVSKVVTLGTEVRKRFYTQSLPVVENGNVSAILYGIVDIEKPKRIYEINIYSDKSSQYIIDTSTGELILDTLHNELSNTNSLTFQDSEAKKGFSKEQVREDFKNGNPGYTVFQSDTAGEYLYMYYTPIGVNRWVAGVSLAESVAMAHARELTRLMYSLMLFVFFAMMLYLLWEWRIMHKNIATKDERLKELAHSKDVIEKIAKRDALTGLENRVSYQEALNKYEEEKNISFGCIYIDANALHEVNNHYGHAAGDEMLKFIAAALEKVFAEDDKFRIGGDEFIIFLKNQRKQEIENKIEGLKDIMAQSDYEISLGFEYRSSLKNVQHLISEAEQKMYDDKRRHYENKDDSTKRKSLDRRIENILSEKRDRDNFLAAISSYFTGVYVLDMNTDITRCIYASSRLGEILERKNNCFSEALEEYIESFIRKEDRDDMRRYLNYDFLDKTLAEKDAVHTSYIKKNGAEISLFISRAADYAEDKRDIIWLFEKNE